MLLAIDVGNTNSVFALYDKGRFLAVFRCATSHKKTADEYYTWILTLLQNQNIPISKIDQVIICTVVPRVLHDLKNLSSNYFGCIPLVVGKESCKLPIGIRVDSGAVVGSDRLANTVGAFSEYGGNLIVVDFGTATNFDIVGVDGAYEGGVIAPGVYLSLKALHDEAAALPHIDVARPFSPIGRNTIDCMKSGIYWGYVGLIREICTKIKIENTRKVRVVATGGLSPLFNNEKGLFDILDLELTIKGLVKINNFNKDVSHEEK